MILRKGKKEKENPGFSVQNIASFMREVSEELCFRRLSPFSSLETRICQRECVTGTGGGGSEKRYL